MGTHIGTKVKPANELASSQKTMSFGQLVEEILGLNDDLIALGFTDVYTFTMRALNRLVNLDQSIMEVIKDIQCMEVKREKPDLNEITLKLSSLQDELNAHCLEDISNLFHRALNRMTLRLMPEHIVKKMEARTKANAS